MREHAFGGFGAETAKGGLDGNGGAGSSERWWRGLAEKSNKYESEQGLSNNWTNKTVVYCFDLQIFWSS